MTKTKHNNLDMIPTSPGDLVLPDQPLGINQIWQNRFNWPFVCAPVTVPIAFVCLFIHCCSIFFVFLSFHWPLKWELALIMLTCNWNNKMIRYWNVEVLKPFQCTALNAVQKFWKGPEIHIQSGNLERLEFSKLQILVYRLFIPDV